MSDSGSRYNYFWCRLLEGTWGQWPSLGVWPINMFRVFTGWGHVFAEQWDAKFAATDYISAEKLMELDSVAKSHRIPRYQRIRTEKDCRTAIGSGRVVHAAFEITKQWRNPKDGRIQLNVDDEDYLGAHSVSISHPSKDESELVFENVSWGPEWGDHGFGYLPTGFFDQNLIDAWIMILHDQPVYTKTFEDAPLDIVAYGQNYIVNGNSYSNQLRDTDSGETIGWVNTVLIDDTLHVEDFYVRPQYRHRALRACSHRSITLAGRGF